MKINVNGRITDPREATLSVLDRGFLYGDSVYEVMRTYCGVLFARKAHLERLAHSADALALALPERSVLDREIDATLRVAAHEESYCRVIVTRGQGPLTLDPTTAEAPNLVIIVKAYEPFPKRVYEQGLRLCIPGVTRAAADLAHPSVKSGNYLSSVLALGRAKQAGYDDALLVDHQGFLTEGTSSNLFAVRRGQLLTPPLRSGLLAGVTRALVMRLAEDSGIVCQEQRLAPDDLFTMDEVLLTSTLREVAPVVEMDGRPIGTGKPGPMFARLRAMVHAAALAQVQATMEASSS
ncbi:MAG: aminotransferase class IV [Myxococcota bacterium]|jgi:branched-chain amino acid aminotransferase|nr:aminotransferase class IV [Myxococcota bacterium]